MLGDQPFGDALLNATAASAALVGVPASNASAQDSNFLAVLKTFNV